MDVRTCSPGPNDRTVRTEDGKTLQVPVGWTLCPPGDAALTRRVKAAGDHWLVQEKKGRRTFSKGIWAAADTINTIRADLDAERSTDAYAKKQESAAKRRQKVQSEYVEDFVVAVLDFLNFHSSHCEVASQLARQVADHATPVGSGTVARTQRIPVERRAEAAVIAWMRHQTTAYDSMSIPRAKGKRREVRRMLAARSKQLLATYRDGGTVDRDCPLGRALNADLKNRRAPNNEPTALAAGLANNDESLRFISLAPSAQRRNRMSQVFQRYTDRGRAQARADHIQAVWIVEVSFDRGHRHIAVPIKIWIFRWRAEGNVMACLAGRNS